MQQWIFRFDMDLLWVFCRTFHFEWNSWIVYSWYVKDVGCQTMTELCIFWLLIFIAHLTKVNEMELPTLYSIETNSDVRLNSKSFEKKPFDRNGIWSFKNEIQWLKAGITISHLQVLISFAFDEHKYNSNIICNDEIQFRYRFEHKNGHLKCILKQNATKVFHQPQNIWLNLVK